MSTFGTLWSGLISATATGDSITAAITDSAGRSGQLDFSAYNQIAIFVQLKTLTGGTSPSVQVIIDSADGQTGGSTYWAHLNGTAPTWTSATNQYRTSAGPGTSNNDSLGMTGRIIWNINGGPSACTFYVTIYGKQ